MGEFAIMASRRRAGWRDLDEVDAAFYYAGTGETIWPHLPDDDALASLLSAVPD